MTDSEYLTQLLKDQTLDPFGDEMKCLEDNFSAVNGVLREAFGHGPRLIKGGSVVKGTLIRESYDLDAHFYFASGDTSAGETLEEIYFNVGETLEKKYVALLKRTAIRLRTRDENGQFADLSIDVVPGRYQNSDFDDVFLYQRFGNKDRLQTNIGKQIDHVRRSGLIDPIRLLKLWNVRNNLDVRTFVLELLVIEILKANTMSPLPDQFGVLLQQFRDALDDIHIEDPANPTGNNLSDAFDADVKAILSEQAKKTLEKIDASGIQSIFGEVSTESSRLARLATIGVSSGRPPTAPWYGTRQN